MRDRGSEAIGGTASRNELPGSVHDGCRPAPLQSRALCGRAKKNRKTADLILAALYRFLAWPSSAGNDAFILANDEGQAADDLDLAKKLIFVSPIPAAGVDVKVEEILRRDGRGRLRIPPAQDAVGAHDKTFLFVGFDRIHGYRTHDLFEDLAPDPTRFDALNITWIISCVGIRHAPGMPLYDLMPAGKRGDDPRMFFSSYGAEFTTDPTFAGDGVTPGRRANPSMANWDDEAIWPSSATACRATNSGACISTCPVPRTARPSARTQ